MNNRETEKSNKRQAGNLSRSSSASMEGSEAAAAEQQEGPSPPAGQPTSRSGTPKRRKAARTRRHRDEDNAKEGTADVPEAPSTNQPAPMQHFTGSNAPSAFYGGSPAASSSMPRPHGGLAQQPLWHQRPGGVPLAAPFVSAPPPANQQQNLDQGSMRQRRIFESFHQQSQQLHGLRPPVAASLPVQRQRQQQQNQQSHQQSGQPNVSTVDQWRQMFQSMQEQQQQRQQPAMQNPLVALSSVLSSAPPPAPAAAVQGAGGAASGSNPQQQQQNSLLLEQLLLRQSQAAAAAPSSHSAANNNALEQLVRQQQQYYQQQQQQLAAAARSSGSNLQQQQQPQGGLLHNQFATSSVFPMAAGLLQQQQQEQQPLGIFDSFFQSQQQLPFATTHHSQALQALLAAQGQPADQPRQQQQQPPRLAPNQQAVPTSQGIPLALPSDVNQLSGYQIFIRHQLEFFVSEQSDCDTNVQGRKKRVRLGQIGIRCRHCAHTPVRQRGRGSVYYPQKLSGVYQAAQNMATTHLAEACLCIPAQTRQELIVLHQRRDTASGGKIFWANACRSIGMTEDDDGIRFRSDEAMERALAGNFEGGQGGGGGGGGGAISKQFTSGYNQLL